MDSSTWLFGQDHFQLKGIRFTFFNLILGYTVYQYPFYRPPDMNGINNDFLIRGETSVLVSLSLLLNVVVPSSKPQGQEKLR